MKSFCKYLLAALVSLSTLTIDAIAADPNDLAEKITNDCGEKWGFPGPVAICIAQKEQEIGKELARAYYTAISRAGKGAEIPLRQSQRSWLNYQEADCKFHQQQAVEGSGSSATYYQTCLLETTLQRLIELQALNSSGGGPQIEKCEGILHRSQGTIFHKLDEGVCTINKHEENKVLRVCSVGSYCMVSGVADDDESGESTEMVKVLSVRNKRSR